MPKTFLGIAASRELTNPETTESFWCVPASAEKGDVILLYCPRAESAARQGLFAESIIETAPGKENDFLCSGFGIGNEILRHVRIKIKRRFKPALTAADMKRDPVLMSSGFVRRNFQGTVFFLQETLAKRILFLAEKKQMDGKLESEI